MGQHRCAFIVQFERKECQDSNSSKSSGEIHILCGCCYAEGGRGSRNSHFRRVLLGRRRSRVEKLSFYAGVVTPKAFASGEIHILCGCCYAEGVREWRNSHFMRVLLRRRRSRVEKLIKCGCCYAEGVREWGNSHFMRVLLRRRRSRVEKITFHAGVVTPKAFASGEIN